MKAPIWSDDPAGAELAVQALAQGGIIGFPTDTVYGIACSATDQAALEQLYRIKARPTRQPLVLMVAAYPELADFAHSNPLAEELAGRFWPGPLTLVLRATAKGSLLRGEGTVGARIPDHPTALALLEKSGPLATTSANRHGQAVAADARSALAALPDLAGALEGAEPGPTPGIPSSILDLTRDQPVLLREGRLSARELGVLAAGAGPEIRRD